MLALVDDVPAHAEHRRVRPALGHPPARGRRPAHRVQAARGRGGHPHLPRVPQGARRARRGHRADPPLPRRGRGPRRPDGAARHRRAPGQRDPQPAAAPAGRAAAPGDPRALRQARGARSLEYQAILASEQRQRDIVVRGARRDRREVRRRAPHDDPAVRRRGQRRGPHRRGGDGRHDHPRRLRQADPVGQLPGAAARRQGRARRAAARGRPRRPLLRHDDAPLAAVLHQPRPRLPRQGVRAARGRPRRQGPARRQPARVPAGREDRPGARHPRLRPRPSTWCWPRSAAW